MDKDQIELLKGAADICRINGMLKHEALLQEIIANEEAGADKDESSKRANRKK